MSNRIVMLLLVLSQPVLVADSSPYADAALRDIKALSSQDIENLRDGKGMGLALAAELNGYPGPKHVLELGDALDLSEEQHVASQQLFDAMQRRAKAIGVKLIDAEQELDRLFANDDMESDLLKKVLEKIGHLQAELRLVHLDAHVRQRELLTAGQVERYIHLRGYGNVHEHSSHGH